MKLATALSAALSCVIGIASGHAATVKFPGRTDQAPSPDRKAVILNTDRDEEPNHVLSIKATGKDTVREVFPYGRYVEVSWSPDSKFFFVNDYMGSDVSRCVIIDGMSLKQHDTAILLEKEMAAIIRHFGGSSWLNTCSSWRPADKVYVSIRVSGNGTQAEVRKRFVFDAKAGKFAAAH
jgi:Tol biopolymer transport system component